MPRNIFGWRGLSSSGPRKSQSHLSLAFECLNPEMRHILASSTTAAWRVTPSTPSTGCPRPTGDLPKLGAAALGTAFALKNRRGVDERWRVCPFSQIGLVDQRVSFPTRLVYHCLIAKEGIPTYFGSNWRRKENGSGQRGKKGKIPARACLIPKPFKPEDVKPRHLKPKHV